MGPREGRAAPADVACTWVSWQCGGIGAGGCPDLQENVCRGGAELVADSHLQDAGAFLIQ